MSGVDVPDLVAGVCGVEGGIGVEVPEAGGVFIGTSGILARAEQLTAALESRYARLTCRISVVWSSACDALRSPAGSFRCAVDSPPNTHKIVLGAGEVELPAFA